MESNQNLQITEEIFEKLDSFKIKIGDYNNVTELFNARRTKYRKPNLFYFDYSLSSSIIDEHFNFLGERANFSPVNAYYKISDKKSRFKKFRYNYLDIDYKLIEKLFRFKYENGIVDNLFHKRYKYSYGSTYKNSDEKEFPLFSNFIEQYRLPLYHIVPYTVIKEIYEKYPNDIKNKVDDHIFKLAGPVVAFNAENPLLKKYLIIFPAKFFAYKIARFLIRNVFFAPTELADFSLFTDPQISIPGLKFVCIFPNVYGISSIQRELFIKETLKYLSIIFANTYFGEITSSSGFSKDHFYSFKKIEFNFELELREDEFFYYYNYPYRSFYIPDYKGTDEEFYRKQVMSCSFVADRLHDGHVLPNKRVSESSDLSIDLRWYYTHLDSNNDDYLVHLSKTEIDYYYKEPESSFSSQSFDKQWFYFLKHVQFNSTKPNYLNFAFPDFIFYQYDKYLERELKLYKKNNNINYEQMLEERKEKENVYDFDIKDNK